MPALPLHHSPHLTTHHLNPVLSAECASRNYLFILLLITPLLPCTVSHHITSPPLTTPHPLIPSSPTAALSKVWSTHREERRLPAHDLPAALVPLPVLLGLRGGVPHVVHLLQA